jgi:competence protein ComGC
MLKVNRAIDSFEKGQCRMNLNPINDDIKPEEPSVQEPTPEAMPDPIERLPDAPVASVPTHDAGPTTVPPVPTAGSNIFLVKQLALLFSGLSVLGGLISLGYVLLDHFIADKTSGSGAYNVGHYINSWHVWLVASIITFGGVYVWLSLTVQRALGTGLNSTNDSRVMVVARSIFMGILVIVATTLVAGLLYLLLSVTLAAADISWRDAMIEIFGAVNGLLWIGVLLWQQHLLGKQSSNRLPVIVIAAGIVLLALLTAIFPILSNRAETIDRRTVSDLTTIQSSILTYKYKHDRLPSSLSDLTIDESSTKGRLDDYKYKVTSSSTSSSSLDDLFGSSSSSSYSIGKYSRQTYQLCATFKTDTTDAASDSPTPAYGGISEGVSTTNRTQSFSVHEKGEQCFDRS